MRAACASNRCLSLCHHLRSFPHLATQNHQVRASVTACEYPNERPVCANPVRRSIASREGNASRLEGLTVGPNAAPRRPANAVPPRTSSQQAQRRGRPGTVDSTCGPGTGILTKAAALGPLRPSSQAASDMLSMKSVDIGNENSAVGFLPPIGSRPHSVLGFGNTMHPTKPDRVQDRNPHKISPGLCI